jgi:hypothetical protein
MVVEPAWAVQSMVASASAFVKNTLISKVLFPICLAIAFLLPWLWLALAYTLKAFVDLTGKVPNFGNSDKDIASCDAYWTARPSTAKTVFDTQGKE